MTAGHVALGIIVRLARSGEIAEIARASGHDFLFIDTQHAAFSLETVAHMAQAARGCGIAPLVRVRRFDDPDIGRLLDAGAEGIIVPDVGSAAQAKRAVDAAKFAPLGRRSVPGPFPEFDYRPVPVGDATARLNQTNLLVCMIETVEGLDTVDEIAAVEGVDVLHVGCVDLLQSLGQPGAFGGPAIMGAIDRVAAAARRHGKHLGVGGDRDLARVRSFIAAGARFLTTQTDVALMLAEATRLGAALRGETGA